MVSNFRAYDFCFLKKNGRKEMQNNEMKLEIYWVNIAIKIVNEFRSVLMRFRLKSDMNSLLIGMSWFIAKSVPIST